MASSFTNKKYPGFPSLPPQPVLFGRDKTTGIVAVEESAPGKIAVWRREDDRLFQEEKTYSPFILVSDKRLIQGFEPVDEVVQLKGDGFFRFLVRVPTMKDMGKIVGHLKKISGINPSAPDVPYYYQKDLIHMYLMETGRTLFKGMTPGEALTMAIDIETLCQPGYEFPNADRPADRIVSIALIDNRGREEVISGHNLDEPAMLSRLTEIITSWDPDIIFGHNIFKFDLTYIARRSAMHNIALPWGRNGGIPRVHNSRLIVAERTFDYPKWEIYGRHIIDTYILTLFYDVSTRELENLTLKDVARALKLADENRTYLDMNRVNHYFEHESELLEKYNMEDARETLAVGHTLGGISFIECQIFPYALQNSVVRGMATKINSLILREYIHRGTAVPRRPEKGKEDLAGGATYLEEAGLIKNVYHCDVKSLYPSILLSQGIEPKQDRLKIFLALLKTLTEFRLKAKDLAKSVDEEDLKLYLDALQRAFKILINSFYGLLASRIHHFSDPEAAAHVTLAGRKLVQTMMKSLKELNCCIIEVDTDGIFFHAPDRPFSLSEGNELVKNVSAAFPKGIDLEIDGLYPAMFSYKIKNYALLNEDGRLILKGSGLKSRGLEPYLRDYLREIILLALQGKAEEISRLYIKFREKIIRHQMPIEKLAKRETLMDSLSSYREKVRSKKRNPAAAYELALTSGRDYRPGDYISYYITGTSSRVVLYRDSRRLVDWDPAGPDENVPYYLSKLDRLNNKFYPLLAKTT